MTESEIRKHCGTAADFQYARGLAEKCGMRLTNPSDGCFQLRWKQHILNLYPRRIAIGLRPRLYYQKGHEGPFLKVEELWTLTDVVVAAVREAAERASSIANKGPQGNPNGRYEEGERVVSGDDQHGAEIVPGIAEAGR